MDLTNLVALSEQTGVSLNQEELYGVKNASMKLLKENPSCKFWGKVEASGADYYVWCSLAGKGGAFPEKKYFYSTNNWAVSELSKSSTTYSDSYKLSGDPAAEIVEGKENEDGEVSDAYTEAHYLYEVVSTIDAENAVVPVGFMQIDDMNNLVAKKNPSSLSSVDAMSLSNYRYLTAPALFEEQVVSGKDADDILSVVGAAKSGDEVKGAWRVVQSLDKSSVILRNLFWPGFSAVYNLTTNTFGYAYIGNGRKNTDVPFML